MADYTKTIARAEKTIAKKGMAATWRVSRATGSKSHSPTGRDEVDHAVNVIFLPLKRIGKESSAMMKNGDQQTANARVLMAGQANFEPDLRDALITAEAEFAIVNIKKLAPNGQAIIYDVELCQ